MAEFDKSRDHATVFGSTSDGAVYVQDGRRFNGQLQDVTDGPVAEAAEAKAKKVKAKDVPAPIAVEESIADIL